MKKITILTFTLGLGLFGLSVEAASLKFLQRNDFHSFGINHEGKTCSFSLEDHTYLMTDDTGEQTIRMIKDIRYMDDIANTYGGWADDSVVSFGWSYNYVRKETVRMEEGSNFLTLLSPLEAAREFSVQVNGISSLEDLKSSATGAMIQVADGKSYQCHFTAQDAKP